MWERIVRWDRMVEKKERKKMKQVNEKHARIKVRRVSRRGNFCGAIISLSRLVQNCVFLISNFLRPYAQVCAFVFIFGLFLCFWRAYLALSLAYALWMLVDAVQCIHRISNLQQKRVLLHNFRFLVVCFVARNPTGCWGTMGWRKMVGKKCRCSRAI